MAGVARDQNAREVAHGTERGFEAAESVHRVRRRLCPSAEVEAEVAENHLTAIGARGKPCAAALVEAVVVAPIRVGIGVLVERRL